MPSFGLLERVDTAKLRLRPLALVEVDVVGEVTARISKNYYVMTMETAMRS